MRYEGYNGQISLEGEALVLSRDGIVAKAGGLSGPPRTLPLAAVSSVGWHEASRLTNGWLSLGLGGVQVPDLSVTSAAKEPDTVTFRRKDAAAFEQLRDWLVTVIEYNAANGIDPSGVSFDPPAKAAVDDEHRELYGNLVKKGVVGLKTVEIYDLGYVRVGVMLTAKSPYEKLRSIEFRAISQDKSAGGRALAGAMSLGLSSLSSNEKRLLSLVIATDRQVHTLTSSSDKGFGRQEDNNLMALEAAGNAVLGVIKDATAVQVTMVQPADQVPAAPSDPDIPDQISKLAALHAAGVLTDDEFASKKTELLNRM